MSDGTLLSFVDGRMWIDGRSHEARIPTEQYLLLLMNSDERKGWDLIKLFLATQRVVSNNRFTRASATIHASFPSSVWAN